MRRMYPNTLPAALDCEQGGKSASEILIFEWVLACFVSWVNRITVDFGADINNELSHRKHDISVR